MMADKNSPLISVVMPVYNTERFVAQAIESVLNQTYQNLELILVNDCSTDKSLLILESYARKDKRVRIISNEKNIGVAHTRNLGIQAAKGAYIALLDSDDLWEETKIEKQLTQIINAQAKISYCSLAMVDEDGKKIKEFSVPETTDYKEMLVRCFFTCSSVLIEATLLKSNLFKAEYYHEDYLLWVELLSQNAKAVGLTEVLAYYRQLTGSRSHSKLKAAINRWRIYRGALGFGFFKTISIFIQYAMNGIRKYYL